MRDLKRNKQTIFYKLFLGKEVIMDEYGNETGEYTLAYSELKEFKLNVSSALGESYTRHFGDYVDYDKVMVTTDLSLLIDESSILWVDDLNTENPHDYIVKKVAKSLNSVSIAVRKVNVTVEPPKEEPVGDDNE